MRIGRVEGDAKAAERGQAVRHHALTASFVDRRARAIGEGNFESLAARGDGGGQTSRPTADYEYIGSAHERWVSLSALPNTGSSHARTVSGRLECSPARQNSASLRLFSRRTTPPVYPPRRCHSREILRAVSPRYSGSRWPVRRSSGVTV